MKKISNFLKLNYKKIIVSVSCLTLLLVAGFSFLKFKQVNASTESYTDLNAFQSFYDNDYFSYNTEYNLNKLSSCRMFHNVPGDTSTHGYSYDFDFVVPTITYAHNQDDVKYYSTLPNFITPTYSNYFYELKRNSNNSYRYTLQANYPIITTYGSETNTHVIFNNVLLFTNNKILSEYSLSQALSSYFGNIKLGFWNSYDDFTTEVLFYPQIFINYQYLDYNYENDDGAYTVQSGFIHNTLGNIISNSSIILDFNFWNDFLTNRAVNTDNLETKFPYVETSFFTSSDLANNSRYTYCINSVEIIYTVAPTSSESTIPTAIPYISGNNPSNSATLYNANFYRDVQNVINSCTYIEQINENTLNLYMEGYQFGYNIGYNDGYAIGWHEGANLEVTTPLDLIWRSVESFLNFEIFPNFKIYYFFLMALGITVFSLVIKYAFGG